MSNWAFCCRWHVKQSSGWDFTSKNSASFAWCGEWQEMQLTSFFKCTELMAFMCCVPPAWQSRQRALISCADAPLKLKILVLSPPPSTWAFPGPWQLSQPCHSGPFFVSKVVTKCGEFSKCWKKSLDGMSAWQVLQVSEPTYSAGSAGRAYLFSSDFLLELCGWACPPIALTAAARRHARTTQIAPGSCRLTPIIR